MTNMQRIAALVALVLVAMWPTHSAHAQACSYQLAKDRIEYGALFASAEPGERLLGTRSTTLTVTCPSPRDLTFEYNGPLPDAQASSWDLDAKGRFEVRVSDVMVDGVPVELNGTGGVEAQNISFAQTLAPGRDVVPYANGASLQGSTLTARVDIRAWLDNGVAVSDATTWLGDGQLHFVAEGGDVALDVEATMIPGACNISVQDVTLDDTPRSAFHPTQAVARPESQQHTLGITCTAPGLVGVRVTDNRTDSRYLVDALPDTATHTFGLGLTSLGNKIGAYRIRITQADASTPGLVLAEGDNASGFAPLPPGRMFFSHGAGDLLTMVDPATYIPQAMSSFTIYYRIVSWLAPANIANITGPESFDGSTTFTIEYL